MPTWGSCPCSRAGYYWGGETGAGGIAPNLPQYAGRTIADLAKERGKDPIDVVCDYMIEDKGATRVLVISISEDDIRDLVRSPQVLVGSDGVTRITANGVEKGS